MSSLQGDMYGGDILFVGIMLCYVMLSILRCAVCHKLQAACFVGWFLLVSMHVTSW